jgi:ribonucleoside-diphosphate reductase alpha chain
METQKNNYLNQTRSAFSGLDQVSQKNVSNKAIQVKNANGTLCPFDINRIQKTITWAIAGFENAISADLILQEVLRSLFDGITCLEIADSFIMSVGSFIERDPAYNYITSRLLLKKLYKEVTGQSIQTWNFEQVYRQSFIQSIELGVKDGSLDSRLLEFDLEKLSKSLQLNRDSLFEYMGLKTLNERYFNKIGNNRSELPQIFWMRVAMGVSLNEADKNESALRFYDIISQLSYVPSTPTLFHSGLIRPQLSSCYLSTVDDDLKHIFKVYLDNALLSKYSGGVANDWSNLRSTGAMIKTINTESLGVIPFLKIVNDVTAAINRSGRRRGATCVYLEVWHLDYEDFLDLRRNTGDERRRTHEINTASWIPDLFMKRLLEDGNWTLFSPDDVPELHHIYGKEFEKRYAEYEVDAQQGKIPKSKVISAAALWRKMLSRLFETGHPWITFKDPSNIRSPQDHVGVVHCSNLCTEIILNTSAQETAVCNLGSINLTEHIEDGALNEKKLANTIEIAMRMLDNVIDINYYPTAEAKTANLRHRPVGLGVMGFQDALYKLNINFDSNRALEFADELGELISYYTILASSKLAKERGSYSTYKGSKWDRNILPQDTIDLLEQERGIPVEVKRGGKLDWAPVREHIKEWGMRNSNCMAIAPTATISNIAGCFPCIEPIYKNLYVKSNMSGEFTVVNKYLVEDLKKLGLWDHDMLELIKYYDGSVQFIEHIPNHLKEKYKEVFEIDAEFLIQVTAQRGKWIDQSQSHNVFMKGVSGKKLGQIYISAWKAGLKTTYYLRTLGASQIEKSTLDAKKFGFTQKREYNPLEESFLEKQEEDMQNNPQENGQEEVIKACSLSSDPDCEVCQ